MSQTLTLLLRLLKLKKRRREVSLHLKPLFRKIQYLMKKKLMLMQLMNRINQLHLNKLIKSQQMQKLKNHQLFSLLPLQPTSTMRMLSATLQGIKILMLCSILSHTSPLLVFNKEDLVLVPRNSLIKRFKDIST
jgi:hypothetical protein